MSNYNKSVRENTSISHLDTDRFILSLEQLKSEASDKELEVYIILGGLCRSSKDIKYIPREDVWEIFHSIDGSFVVYNSTDRMIELNPNIIKAIKYRCLIKYED